MKTWLFFSCFLALFAQAGLAQVATAYQFTQSSGTYTPITGTVLVSGTFDDGIFPVTIPTFKFNGTNFTTLYVNENGWVGFRTAGAITSTSSYTPISSGPTADGIIAPFGRDLNNAASGSPSVSWAVIGTEIVVQWQDVRRYSSTSTEDFSFQLHLDTVSGVISAIYSSVTGTTTATGLPQIGLRGVNNTFATNVNNRLLNTGGLWNATSNGTSNTSTVYIDDATSSPTSGQIFSWVPVTCFPPTGVTTANITTNSTDINWTAPTSGTPAAYGWEVVAHGAGPYATPIAYNYAFGTTANTGAVLTPNTQYDVYVKTGCSLTNLSDTSLWTSVATFTTLATCIVPSALTASGVTTTGATITWNSSPSAPANGYVYEAVAAGAGSGATPVASGAVPAGDTTATFSGLSPSTSYDLYVRASCSSTDSSNWIGPVRITTLCVAITSLPWTEGFESLPATAGTNIYPNCWAYSNITSTNYSCAATCNSNTAHGGSNFIGGSWSFNVWEYTPGFQLTAGTYYDYSFWYRTTDATNGYVVVSAYGTSAAAASMTNVLGTITNAVSSGAYTKVTYTFQVPSTGVYYFGLHDSCPTSAPNGIAFDDFSLQLSPTCIAPTALALTGSTATSASISWTASLSAPANGYIYKAVASGAGASGTAVASGTTAAGVTTATVTGLTASTAYDIYVRGVCSSTDTSTWLGPLSLTTPCTAISSLPWTEGFETLPATAGANVYPTCWAYTNLTSNNYSCSATCNSNTSHAGTNFIGGSWSFNVWEYTPGFQLTAGTYYDYSFWYRTTDATNGYVVVSAYGTAPTRTAMTNVLGTITNAVSSGAYTTVTYTFQVPTTGVYYLGLHDSCPTSAPNGIAFDDFSLQLTPACTVPTALTAGVVTATGATFSWTASVSNPSNGYNWEVVASS
ncbi:MAG: fibronectin type III domain-containing protein, partial [Bacteroidetes bacterium]|nr:fibronectin type III domain-containing protein [Bacteroidota bacterium]